MARFLLGLVELGVRAAVHLLFAFFVFSTTVAGDISQAAAVSGCPLRRRQAQPAGLVDVAATGEEDVPVVLHGSPPPIVLVHGIFNFSKGGMYVCTVKCRQGHYPVWDEQNPVHFVGHSADAQVVRVLHQMLADKAFRGHDTFEDWVLSLTSLSGALNGTTRTYYDGMLTIQTCYPVAYPFLYTVAIVLIFEGVKLHGGRKFCSLIRHHAPDSHERCAATTLQIEQQRQMADA